MSDLAIGIDAVSKRYRIGAKQPMYRTLRDTLMDAVAKPVRRAAAALRGRAVEASEEEIWALKDLSLEIGMGEVVGIIGRNGAGKSTLLKIIARITEPTRGRIGINGRVGSLLEVGTGFHPELTGRENIYLNSAILGMRRAEIESKFDEIVAFSELEKFLDTPVKRYSSGMYMRLAFAVAAHLEPEILIVDEVLAVGDAAFQKKCLDMMQKVGSSGRTVLFVSHNMQTINRLCGRAILLDEGRVKSEGPAHWVTREYLNPDHQTAAVREWLDPAKAPGDDVVRLRAVRVRTEDGRIAHEVDIREPVGIELEYDVLRPGHVFHPHFGLRNEDDVILFIAQDVDPAWRRRSRPPGRYISTGWIPGNLLAEGTMFVSANVMTLNPETVHASEKYVAAFQVVDSLIATDTARGDYPRPIRGVVRPLLKWTTKYTPSGRLSAASK